MGVRLTDDEAWAFLENGHIGILTSLRRDGWPVSLPVWFVVLDRRTTWGHQLGA
ncbi:MAG: pyridoxamine 5'-phosphate oxidase family protein [Acidimicrobiales bacterium]